MDASEKNRIPVIDRMMEILALIASQPDGASIGELVSGLQQPRSTVYRIANTLQAHGVVRRHESGRYTLGPRLLALASQVPMARSGTNLAAATLPHLQLLSARLGECSKLSVLDARMALVLLATPGPRSYALTAVAGERLPLHAGAASKILLAHLERDEQDAILQAPLETFTDRTLTDPTLLRRELARIRRQGWSHDEGEYQPNVEAYGAPVHGRDGRVVGAVSVPFLAGREPREKDAIRTAVIATARLVTA